jgi:hypothetical protein
MEGAMSKSEKASTSTYTVEEQRRNRALRQLAMHIASMLPSDEQNALFVLKCAEELVVDYVAAGRKGEVAP